MHISLICQFYPKGLSFNRSKRNRVIEYEEVIISKARGLKNILLNLRNWFRRQKGKRKERNERTNRTTTTKRQKTTLHSYKNKILKNGGEQV